MHYPRLFRMTEPREAWVAHFHLPAYQGSQLDPSSIILLKAAPPL